jgi:GNAT superfamily N-acetyltransferase
MTSASAVTIRPVTTSDFEAWLPLWAGYNKFYGRFGPTALSGDITVMTWSRFFDVYEPVHALVAESGGELVGLTHYLYHRSTTRIGPVCYLQDLFTAESVRGKGVGKALIEAVYERRKPPALPASTGKPTRPTPPPCGCMTRWRRTRALWCTPSR